MKEVRKKERKKERKKGKKGRKIERKKERKEEESVKEGRGECEEGRVSEQNQMSEGYDSDQLGRRGGGAVWE